MATEGTIGLAEPSTITKSVRTVVQQVNGSNTHQEILTLGGAESTLEIMRVQATAPASTAYGAVVRIASGPSSAVDLQARVNQGVGNSSAADRWSVITAPASTLWASSAGFHFDSSGALQVSEVKAPTLSNLTNSTISATSTATTLLSSAATTPYISAFILTSTDAGPHVGGFYAGSTLVWPVTIWPAGGVANVMQQVAAPGYVFAGQAGRPLEFRTPGSSGVFIRCGLTYWQG